MSIDRVRWLLVVGERARIDYTAAAERLTIEEERNVLPDGRTNILSAVWFQFEGHGERNVWHDFVEQIQDRYIVIHSLASNVV